MILPYFISKNFSPFPFKTNGCEEHPGTDQCPRSDAGMMFAGMVTAMLALMSSGAWDAQSWCPGAPEV